MLRLLCVGLSICLSCTDVAAQRVTYSTHDWQNVPPVSNDGWAGTATPGNGLTYSVGTTIVSGATSSVAPLLFSNAPCLGVDLSVPLWQPASNGRQVVVLHATDAAGTPVWQRYFYGRTLPQIGNGLSNYARGVSVAVAPSDADTRILIFGDTFDEELPNNLAAGNNLNATLYGQSAGFFSMYDGTGDLLWSYMLVGEDGDAATAVTDAIVRWDQVAGEDVVTYCGVSSNGDFDDQGASAVVSTMSPLLPFASPPTIQCAGVVYAGGAAHNAFATGGLLANQVSTQQSDGFVGRMSPVHGGVPLTANRVFHSIVGGKHMDGLFGLVELDDDRFAVVGATETSAGAGGSGPYTYPLTQPYFRDPNSLICLSSYTGHHGVLSVFNSSTLGTTGLVLEFSTVIGSAGYDTEVRDVAAQGGWIYVVGSTTDPTMSDYWTVPAVGVDRAFVAAMDMSTMQWTQAAYLADGAETGAVGIAGWSEYPDHVFVSGWTRAVGSGPRDVFVTSLFHDKNTSPDALVRLRECVYGGTGSDDKPGAATYPNTTFFLNSFAYLPRFGDMAGGGLAVDERGLVTVVGSTFGTPDFTVAGGLPASTQHGVAPSEPDAIRSVVDMLPAGVCRTDGTGTCFLPLPIDPSADGGTTPTCALAIVDGVVSTGMARMLIDFEGLPQPGYPAAILLDRPPAAAVYGGVLQLGFPATDPMTNTVLPNTLLGVEMWTTGTTSTFVYTTPSGSIRESLWGAGGLPNATGQFTFQFLFLMPAPQCPPPLTPGIDWAASPALMVGY